MRQRVTQSGASLAGRSPAGRPRAVGSRFLRRPLERSGSTIGLTCSGFALCASRLKGVPAVPEKTLGSVELASAYDELSNPQFTHGKELIALLDIGRGDRVLDIGRGTGRLAAFTVERVGAEGRIVGVDPAPPRIQLALQHGDRRLEFRIGQAQDLSPFGNATFDVAYMNSVLNWIDDRPKAFGEAYRVLKPRGRLGVATTVRDRPNQLRLLARRAWRIATGRGADTATDNSLSEQCGPSTPRPRPRSVTCSRMRDS
jgi:SAM-dependent methyltransferase